MICRYQIYIPISYHFLSFNQSIDHSKTTTSSETGRETGRESARGDMVGNLPTTRGDSHVLESSRATMSTAR